MFCMVPWQEDTSNRFGKHLVVLVACLTAVQSAGSILQIGSVALDWARPFQLVMNNWKEDVWARRWSFSSLSLCHTSSRCDAAAEHRDPLIKRQRSGAKPNLPAALLVAHKSNEYVGGGWQRAQLRKCSEGFRLVEKCRMVHLWPTISQEVAALQLVFHIPLKLSL